MIESTSEGNTYSEVSSNLQHSESSESSTDLEISSSSLSNLHDSDFSSRHIGPLEPCLGASTTEHDLRKSVIGLLKRKESWVFEKLYCYESAENISIEKEKIPIFFIVLEKMIFERNRSRYGICEKEIEEEMIAKELLEEYERFVSKTEKDCLDRTDFSSRGKGIYKCLKDCMEGMKHVECSRKSVEEATELLKGKLELRKIESNPTLLMCLLNDILREIFKDALFYDSFIKVTDVEQLLTNFEFIGNLNTHPDFLDSCWKFCQHIAIKCDLRRVDFWQNFFNHYQNQFGYDHRFDRILQKVWRRIGHVYPGFLSRAVSRASYQMHIRCIHSTLIEVPKAKDSEFESELINMPKAKDSEFESELLEMGPKKSIKKYCAIIVLRDFYYKEPSPIAFYSTYMVGNFFEQILSKQSKYKALFKRNNVKPANRVGLLLNEALENFRFDNRYNEKENRHIITSIECTLSPKIL